LGAHRHAPSSSVVVFAFRLGATQVSGHHRDPVMTAHLTGGESLRGRTGSPRKEIDMSDVSETADVIIVGGGSAGAVLAARLSQDPARTVLLLEAGHAYAPGAFPREVLDAGILADP